MVPACDGQLGAIVRLYREWKISGNHALIEHVWEKAAKALDFAFTYWDKDGDDVLESQQNNTYDIEFYGANGMMSSIFYAALKAGIEMAEYMKDEERAARYKVAFEQGSARADKLLWNGEYYIQAIQDVNQYRYQFGIGCHSDQLLGQFMAHVAGLGYVLPQEHVKKALKSVFDYNFLPSVAQLNSVQRTYTLNDESGLVLCSWPKGGRPTFPFAYCDEVWTGVEYQVAAHLIYEGFLDEGLTIVKSIRDRHDGYRRNPWSENEAGHHYVRAMASWGLLTALGGFQYDMVKGTMSFTPVIHTENFSTFWITGKAWGLYTQKKNPETGSIEWNIEILYGNLDNTKVNEPL